MDKILLSFQKYHQYGLHSPTSSNSAVYHKIINNWLRWPDFKTKMPYYQKTGFKQHPDYARVGWKYSTETQS